MLACLDERANGLEVQTVCADARSFALERRDFAPCLAPMQTSSCSAAPTGVWLSASRARARATWWVVACATLGELEPFDCSQGTTGPAAERAHVGGLLYLSRATRVSEQARSVVIERERRVIVDQAHAGGRPTTRPCDGGGLPEHDVIELDRLSARELEREGCEVGLRPLMRREVPATDEHVGSVVVVLGV